MKLHVILLVGFIVGLAGCAESEQPPAEPVAEAPAETPEASAPSVWRDAEFIAYMHQNAENLDELNFALADGDLETAKARADWLAKRDTAAGIETDWLPHLYRMRLEAEAVVAAEDIESARDAAMRITGQCQECHAEAGVNPQ